MHPLVLQLFSSPPRRSLAAQLETAPGEKAAGALLLQDLQGERTRLVQSAVGVVSPNYTGLAGLHSLL